jgi:hypothetical protein
MFDSLDHLNPPIHSLRNGIAIWWKHSGIARLPCEISVRGFSWPKLATR